MQGLNMLASFLFPEASAKANAAIAPKAPAGLAQRPQ